ncbi:MAG: nuclear transport factor 2 family protein [Acidobacteriota bacterium]
MKYENKVFYLNKVFIFIVLFFLLNFASFGSKPAEKQQVISVVKDFFKVLEDQDSDLAKKILLPEGGNFSIREKGNKKILKHTGFNELISSLGKSKKKYREIIFSPKVLVHKDIAVLWAEYKFYVDGKFSHCGVDSFSLIKIGGNWKIAGIIYTVEKSECNN